MSKEKPDCSTCSRAGDCEYRLNPGEIIKCPYYNESKGKGGNVAKRGKRGLKWAGRGVRTHKKGVEDE